MLPSDASDTIVGYLVPPRRPSWLPAQLAAQYCPLCFQFQPRVHFLPFGAGTPAAQPSPSLHVDTVFRLLSGASITLWRDSEQPDLFCGTRTHPAGLVSQSVRSSFHLSVSHLKSSFLENPMPRHSRWYHASCFYQDQPLWIHTQLLLFSPHIKFITKPWRLLLLNILSPWPQSGPKPLSLSLGSPLEPNLVCHLQPSMLRSWEAKLLQNKQIEGSTTFCKSLGISPGLWGTRFPRQALQQVLTSSSIC